MATIKDVAEEAGVSIATVSFYINKKRVSEKNSKKIADAIKKLNYIASNPGRTLRLKSNHMGIIFPNIRDPYLEKIFHGIKGYFHYHEIPFLFELSDNNPDKEISILNGFIGRGVNGIIVYTCQTEKFSIFQTIENKEIPYVLINRKPPNYDGNFVSADNYSLLREITQSLIAKGYSKILLITGSIQFSDNFLAKQAFIDECSKASNYLFYKHLHTTPVREGGFKVIYDYFRHNQEIPQCIITTSYHLAEGVRYALELNRLEPKNSLNLISLGDSVDDVFFQDSTIIKTSRNAFKIGETSADLLLENSKSPKVFETKQIIIKDPPQELNLPTIDQLKTLKPAISPSLNSTLNVLLIDDYDSVSALQNLLIDFQQKEKIKVNFIKVLPENLHEYLLRNIKTTNSKIDVYLFDIPWLEYLAKNNFLLPISDFILRDSNSFNHYIPNALETFGKVDDTYYAVPYMCTTQLLFYRKDLFSDELLNRKFEDMYKLPLQPPENWAYYKSICEFFTKSSNPHSPTNYGHAMDLAYTEEILGAFYPRLWASNETLFNKRGKPMFNTLSARNAIKNIVQCTKFAYPSFLTDRPVDTIEKLINGEVAMAITYYNYATDLVNKGNSSFIEKIGWADLPGNNPVLGGWSFGINPNCKNPDEAMKFISWSSSKNLAVAYTILGGQSPSFGTYQNYDLISLYPWLSKAVDTIAKAKKRETPKAAITRGYSEKMVEDVIFDAILQLIELSEKGENIDTFKIEKALTESERKAEQLAFLELEKQS